MTEYAPQAIKDLFNTVQKAIPSALMGGIVGDSAHTYGYHRGRNYVGGDDYSVQYAEDKQGDGEAASALDISWNSASDHYTVSQRLLNAANDSRMNPARSFFGSADGYNVIGYDYKGNYPCTSDDSHLWHVHLSILRQFCNDGPALQGIAAVITAGASGGGSPPVTPPSGGGTLHRAWPSYMGPNDYFGDINGPNESHGGYYANEQPDVKAIQQRLIELGYVPGVSNPSSSWADGKWEQPTTDACAAWQREEYSATTTLYGQCWSDDWAHLFTY
ncbi:MAG TPA: peptidoglycan-binding domain-containing protein [Scandinavium sp.]|jgi:hypothetical protein|uniref:peptidoglycan-binding domain-containing protein n=1 Tax=Scandinavium sp. TaxID=2830653 RepID=UPI002E3252B2|nr:peptidoglycan-binding domain-containing protein [Scandinavium sp.]HEX4502180.1 peptidoglycan-binding domain-containing protein [Scandinavium sp.]